MQIAHGVGDDRGVGVHELDEALEVGVEHRLHHRGEFGDAHELELENLRGNLAAGGLGKRRAADHLRGFGFGHREIDDLEGVVPERSDADQIEGKNRLEIDDGLGLGNFFVDLEIVGRGRERGRAEDEFPRVEPEGVEDGVDVGVRELERDELVFGFGSGDSR